MVKRKACIFISGSGTNLRSIIKNSRDYNFPVNINLVISNKKNVKGIYFAKKFSIPYIVLDFKKEKFEKKAIKELLDRKIDLLVQLVPAFIIGLHCNKLNGQAVLIGIVFGLIVSLVLPFSGFDFVENGKVYGIHPGLIGLIPNTTVALLGSYIPRNRHE